MFERFKRRRQLGKLEEVIQRTFLAELLTDLLKIIESKKFYQSNIKVFPDETIVGTLSEVEKAIHTLYNENLQASKFLEALVEHRKDGRSLIPEERIDALKNEIVLGQEKASILWDLLCLMVQERLNLDPMTGVVTREGFQLVLGHLEEEGVPDNVTIQ